MTTRGILSRLASPLSKPSVTPSKAPVAPNPPVAPKVLRSVGHSGASGFTPSAAPRKLVLEAPVAPALPTVGGTSFRLAQGVALSKAAQALGPESAWGARRSPWAGGMGWTRFARSCS